MSRPGPEEMGEMSQRDQAMMGIKPESTEKKPEGSQAESDRKFKEDRDRLVQGIRTDVESYKINTEPLYKVGSKEQRAHIGMRLALEGAIPKLEAAQSREEANEIIKKLRTESEELQNSFGVNAGYHEAGTGQGLDLL